MAAQENLGIFGPFEADPCWLDSSLGAKLVPCKEFVWSRKVIKEFEIGVSTI